MKPFLRVALGLAALALGWWLCSPALSEGPHDPAAAGANPEKKFEDFDKVVKGAKEYEGLFKLYQKDEHLYAEIRRTSSTSRSSAPSPSPSGARPWAATRSTSTSSGC